ncbi:MAG TPA: hypothetical protein VJQ08_09325 [Candidatus Dormibacteraeota bacterium]|nr:hypothetical protein [Candidatus Dormibacteraeota bacterium]
MEWLAAVLVLSLGIGLRRKPSAGAHMLLVAAITVVVGAWYLAQSRSA